MGSGNLRQEVWIEMGRETDVITEEHEVHTRLLSLSPSQLGIIHRAAGLSWAGLCRVGADGRAAEEGVPDGS